MPPFVGHLSVPIKEHRGKHTYKNSIITSFLYFLRLSSKIDRVNSYISGLLHEKTQRKAKQCKMKHFFFPYELPPTPIEKIHH